MRDVRTKTIILLVLIIAASAQAQSTIKLDANPSISKIATNFTNYVLITEKPVFVNLELAILCRGASQAEVDAARVKYGPHANTAISIYMDNSATDAFTTNATAFPVGAVIVKQKTISGHRDNQGKWIAGGNTGVGGMVKRPAGYDPAHGDWEYFYFEDPKKIESGHIASCVQCHEAAKDKDHVFGTWRGQVTIKSQTIP